MKVQLSKINPSPDNAAGRSEMNEAMEELIATIKAVGVCEGISVRPNGNGYEVIGGERRLFAAKQAGLKEVDVIVHEVDEAQARLMRLASLAHEDWEFQSFASAIWRELTDRELSQKELAALTGIPAEKVSRAAGYITANEYDAVVEFDGEVQATATAFLGRWLSGNPNGIPFAEQIAKKWSGEKLPANTGYKRLLPRIKKALPATVSFGDPDDKDYEEHNFELDAVLRVPWGVKPDDEYEAEVDALAKGAEEIARAEWEANRLKDAEVKPFVKAIGEWQKSLRGILKIKHKLTFEHAQFIENKMQSVFGLEAELQDALEKAQEERRV